MHERQFFFEHFPGILLSLYIILLTQLEKNYKGVEILAILGAVRQLPLIHTFFRILETCGTTNPFAISGRISGNGSWQEAAKKWQQEKLSW